MSTRRPVFLSPHPDDAVWSCGGRLLNLVRAGERPVVVTVFDGDPFGEVARGWRRVASPALRRDENIRALAAIDAVGISLGLVDAALRFSKGMPVYADAESLLGPIDLADEPLVTHLAARLLEVLHPNDLVHVPVAGPTAHVDHQIVRLAVERGSLGNVLYYEDFPYAWQRLNPPSESEIAVVDSWIAAASLYRSQAIAIFGDSARFAATLGAWARR
ncbi:PIG-L deacetylase family protein [Bradyrhizobium diazoefficiens]|uniref:PIG-L deacetylase family protein n=1 Tax=Bradyrhizobium diazoefficiens TaxID=1355477 RepID=UPI002811D610|nr:PIG-L family deacetylase [Bradyrhizobium diazoefficiens]